MKRKQHRVPAGSKLRARSLTQSSSKDPEGEGSVGWSFPFRLEPGGEAVVTLANPSLTEEVSYCVFLLYRGET